MNIYKFECSRGGRVRSFIFPAEGICDAYERGGRKLIDIFVDLSDRSYSEIEHYADIDHWLSCLVPYMRDHEGIIVSDISEED